MKDDTPIEEGVLNLRLSDVRAWLQCPRRFYFEVLEQLYPQPATPAADAASEVEYEVDEEFVVTERPAKRRDEGTLVHTIPEAHYRGEFDGLDELERLEAVDRIIDLRAKELTTDIHEKSWVDARRYAKASARGFSTWIGNEGLDVGKEVVAVEERIGDRLPFSRAGGPFREFQLTGQPDLMQLDHMTEEHEVGDHKHVQTLKNAGPRDSDFQLVGYAWLYERATGERVSWAYQNLMARSLQTARATPPFYRRVPIAITDDKLRAFEEHLRTTLADIAKWVNQLDLGRPPGHLRYSETLLCGWMCRTQLVCDAMSSGVQGSWQETANAYYGGKYSEVFDD